MIYKDNCNVITQHKHRPRGTGGWTGSVTWYYRLGTIPQHTLFTQPVKMMSCCCQDTPLILLSPFDWTLLNISYITDYCE